MTPMTTLFTINVKATFFLIGSNIPNREVILKDLLVNVGSGGGAAPAAGGAAPAAGGAADAPAEEAKEEEKEESDEDMGFGLFD